MYSTPRLGILSNEEPVGKDTARIHRGKEQQREYVGQLTEELGCRSYVELKTVAQDRRRWKTVAKQSVS